MSNRVKRAAVYFDSQLHHALRIKAANTDRSISELVNDAIRLSLAEDMEHIGVFKERADEPGLSFEDILKELRHGGKI
ncbi:CopG family transcriptional regulator [bacterium]|nr:CopG family transcriptional regulator [bacterium]